MPFAFGFEDGVLRRSLCARMSTKKNTRTGWDVKMERQRLTGEHWGQYKSTESVFISISVFFLLVKLLNLLKKY